MKLLRECFLGRLGWLKGECRVGVDRFGWRPAFPVYLLKSDRIFGGSRKKYRGKAPDPSGWNQTLRTVGDRHVARNSIITMGIKRLNGTTSMWPSASLAAGRRPARNRVGPFALHRGRSCCYKQGQRRSVETY